MTSGCFLTLCSTLLSDEFWFAAIVGRTFVGRLGFVLCCVGLLLALACLPVVAFVSVDVGMYVFLAVMVVIPAGAVCYLLE